MDCTRQNILKLVRKNADTFPIPINGDRKSSNWHLAQVLRWYQFREVDIDIALLEVAEFAMEFNRTKQYSDVGSEDLKQKARDLALNSTL